MKRVLATRRNTGSVVHPKVRGAPAAVALAALLMGLAACSNDSSTDANGAGDGGGGAASGDLGSRDNPVPLGQPFKITPAANLVAEWEISIDSIEAEGHSVGEVNCAVVFGTATLTEFDEEQLQRSAFPRPVGWLDLTKAAGLSIGNAGDCEELREGFENEGYRYFKDLRTEVGETVEFFDLTDLRGGEPEVFEIQNWIGDLNDPDGEMVRTAFAIE